MLSAMGLQGSEGRTLLSQVTPGLLRLLDPSLVRIPHKLVQLELEPHRKLIGDDLLGQPAGASILLAHGAEEVSRWLRIRC